MIGKRTYMNAANCALAFDALKGKPRNRAERRRAKFLLRKVTASRLYARFGDDLVRLLRLT